MHVEHLMTFTAVAHLRSFTRAAHVLSLSQSAVSQQVKELEGYFGHALFERTTRRLALTAAGEHLLVHATEMIAQLKAAKAELHELAGRPRGLLAIGCTTTIAIYRLPEIVTRLQLEPDTIRLSVRVGALPELVQGLQSGELEAALASQQLPAPARADFCHEAFADDELVLIVKPGHRWTLEGEIEPAELLAEPLVARQEGSPTRAQVTSALNAVGVEPTRIVIELGNTEAIKRAVAGGLGFGFASRCAIQHELAAGFLAEVKVRGLAVARKLWIITPCAPRRSARAERFRELLLEREPTPARTASLPGYLAERSRPPRSGMVV